MKRFIIFCLVLTCALSVTLLGVSAVEENAETVPAVSDGDAVPVSIGAATSDDTADISAETNAPRNFGDTINDIWDHYASEIFSALTLITSLLLAYFYKRGLVPVLLNGLDRMHRAGVTAQDAAQSLIDHTDENLSAFIARAEPLLAGMETATTTVATLSDYVRTLETRLEAGEDDRTLMTEVMRGVADMLYGVFTSANLPAYAKEQIGERYRAITTALGSAGDIHDKQETDGL